MVTKMEWLLKTEPSDYSFQDLARDGTATWTGVTNPTAVKNIRAMKKGDRVVVYHTGDVRAAVGLATIISAPRSDPDSPKSAVVEIKAGRPLKDPVPLETIKGNRLFSGSLLVTIGRLSVVPLAPGQYEFLAG